MVLGAEIAGAEPLAEEGVLRLLRVVPVALHHVRAADDDFANGAVGKLVSAVVDDLHLTIGTGRPTDAGLRTPPIGFMQVAGEHSVGPSPS